MSNLNNLEQEAIKAVNDIGSRAGKSGQFLNWIDVLPKNQLNNINAIYNLADEAKKDGFTDLAILGIGGSRHTTEAMLKMLGEDSHIHFYSGIDPESFKRFVSSLDLNKTKFLVVSKSGGTLETTVAYENAKKLLQEKFNTQDVSDRFIAMTDQSNEKSKLRQIVDKGDIKLSGLVHDDVGGRFSIFDDATLFTMAYSGVNKETAKKMLEASIKAQEEFLTSDFANNEALQLAVFNADSALQGRKKHFVEYFGDAFEGATLWEKQMKNESLKSRISTDTNIGPGYLHYNAESDLDPNNKDSFYTFVYVKTSDKATNALMNGAMKAYKAQHPVSEIVLKDLSPESVARFIELKHFETLYTGNILRQKEGLTTPLNEPMPEVIQPNVEIYKKEVKKNLTEN
jgi:glucose-6-phosphate isomerase